MVRRRAEPCGMAQTERSPDFMLLWTAFERGSAPTKMQQAWMQQADPPRRSVLPRRILFPGVLAYVRGVPAAEARGSA
eukprot:scaffold2797_cov234-Pinguiococcus_pyrenoidosus.AAC.7